MDKALRSNRRLWLRYAILIPTLLALASLTLLARGLILPCAVAIVLAYLCKPLVYILRGKGWSAHLAVMTVAFFLIGSVLICARVVIGALPQGLDRIQMMVRAEHRLNAKVERMLRLNQPDETQAHWIYRSFGAEIDYAMSQLNGWIQISPLDQHELLLPENKGRLPSSEEIQNMLQENLKRPRWTAAAARTPAGGNDAELKQHITQVLSSFSVWLLFPIVFFFLLGDDGSIFRYFMGFVPNHYFELVLTMLERVDRALGHYLRGTALECLLVGAVIGLGLFLFGVDPLSAAFIGLVSGVTNAIPFLGTLVGLAMGLGYGLMVEEIHPVLPFLTADDLLLGVVASVTVAHLLDNALFQPILVGKAVNLHPIVVVLSVAVAGMAFGLWGVLLAIPSVVVINTCLKTLVSGLKDYRLI
ncbi:MAG: AI-2E family transporter [Bdellovibrionales bacterium]